MKKTRLVYFLDLFGGRVEKEWCDLLSVEHLQMIELMVVLFLLMFLTYSEYGFRFKGSWSYSR